MFGFVDHVDMNALKEDVTKLKNADICGKQHLAAVIYVSNQNAEKILELEEKIARLDDIISKKHTPSLVAKKKKRK